MKFYEFIGSTETLFDQGGLANESNFLFDDINEFESQNIELLSKEDFVKKVALPYKLGFLIENNDINFSHAPKNDLVIAQDDYDGICYIFSKQTKGE
jgi:hypothetical protein